MYVLTDKLIWYQNWPIVVVVVVVRGPLLLCECVSVRGKIIIAIVIL